jgi:D-alanyl-D-alanine carboxypeptidase (penicillin-binding protein 5/6)
MFEGRAVNRRRFLKVTGAALVGIGATSRFEAQAPDVKPLPAKEPAERIDGPPVVSARAWAIADGATGRLLWGAQEAQPLNMASTTKVMTGWLVLQLATENARVLDEVIIVSEAAGRTAGSSARIRPGDRIAVRDMLYGLLLPSGNDAAAALAEHFGQRFRPPQEGVTPVAAFVAQMNRQAETLQLGETSYRDPHGLGNNRISARNLATLAWHAMQNSLFRQYVSTRRHQGAAADTTGATRSIVWDNTNRLLGIEGYEGIKTGTTTAAGSCLVGSGRHAGDHLLVVVLGATSNDSRYIDTRNLFRWAWRQRQERR